MQKFDMMGQKLRAALPSEHKACKPIAHTHARLQTFLTLLSEVTAPHVEALLTTHILKGLRPAELSRTPPAPPSGSTPHVLFEQYWVKAGPMPLPEADAPDDFVVTPSVRRHLATLARAVLLRRHPILLQVRRPRGPGFLVPCVPDVLGGPARKRNIMYRLITGDQALITKTGPPL